MLKEIQEAIDHEACEEQVDIILSINPKSLDDLIGHPNAPYWAYWYAANVIKGPWPKGEDAIASDASCAYNYAVNVIRGRWPKGEDAIARDAKFSYWYSLTVIKLPWPKGEDAIASNADLAYMYARKIIVGPWTYNGFTHNA